MRMREYTDRTSDKFCLSVQIRVSYAAGVLLPAPGKNLRSILLKTLDLPEGKFRTQAPTNE
jgi:hypothetical protein